MEWHSLEMTNHSNGDITARVEVLPDSPWFSGHFPDDPILPGIALLAMVFEVISRTQSRKCIVTGVKKIRFKRKVKPNDRLIIKVKENDQNALFYSFEITCRNEVACTGMLSVSDREDDSQKKIKNRYD